MIARRQFVAALTASAIVPAALAQGGRAARIGWLSYLAEPDAAVALLRDGMKELGYVEGTSYVIVPRFANNDFTRLPKLVEELAGQNIDVLVTRGPSTNYTIPVRARIPVVFAFSGDPVDAGFAETLRRPGRNMTGITFMAMELSGKRVEVLMEMVPKATRIALLSNPEHAGELSEYRVTEETARKAGATITRYLVRDPQQLAESYATIAAARPDAMLVFPDSLTLTRRKDIAEFAARAKIPCIYGWTEFAEAGGLLSYGPTLTDSFKLLAAFVDKILRGGSASTIPIEQVSKIVLTVNLSAAKALGIALPQSLLVRADRVIS